MGARHRTQSSVREASVRNHCVSSLAQLLLSSSLAPAAPQLLPSESSTWFFAPSSSLLGTSMLSSVCPNCPLKHSYDGGLKTHISSSNNCCGVWRKSLQDQWLWSTIVLRSYIRMHPSSLCWHRVLVGEQMSPLCWQVGRVRGPTTSCCRLVCGALEQTVRQNVLLRGQLAIGLIPASGFCVLLARALITTDRKLCPRHRAL